MASSDVDLEEPGDEDQELTPSQRSGAATVGIGLAVLALFIVLALLLGRCDDGGTVSAGTGGAVTTATTGASTTTTTTTSSTTTTIDPAAEADALVAAVQAALAGGGDASSGVTVRAGRESGVVVLEGEVPDEAARARAVEVAGAVAGVTSVEDRLEVAGVGVGVEAVVDADRVALRGGLGTQEAMDGVVTATGNAVGPDRVDNELTLTTDAPGAAPTLRLTGQVVDSGLFVDLRNGADAIAAAAGLTVVDELTLQAPATTAELENQLNALFADASVLFATGSAVLSPAATRTLDQAVAILTAVPTGNVEIGGHTDNVGAPAGNLALSEARAVAVRDYLVANGVVSDRLSTVGYGQDQPVADNASVEGRALNRRIEFRVT